LKEKIKQLAKDYYEDVVGYRRHIHAHPELSFSEVKTAKFITEQLRTFDIPFQEGVAKTGIVALIEGRNPAKKTVALRADMDALPIQETNDVPYRSTVSGVMHACGHDVHTSSLLGCARILAQLKGELEGTIKFIFQPAEEKLPGGASMMIKEGVLENPKPDGLFGQHVTAGLEVGKVGFRSGKYMASADEIYLTVKGKGGHAAMPDKVVNPVLISSHIIVGLQQIGLQAEPSAPTVLAFGKVIAEGATNIIPDQVKIEGTLRTMDEQWRKKAHQQIKKIAQQTAKDMGGKCEVDIRVGYPLLVNDVELTERAKGFAKDYMGAENVVDLDIKMTAEDFAYYSQQTRTCFYRLGVGNQEKGITSSVHTSTFDIDEKALEIGMGMMSWLAVAEILDF